MTTETKTPTRDVWETTCCKVRINAEEEDCPACHERAFAVLIKRGKDF
jgi:hypothetical protein